MSEHEDELGSGGGEPPEQTPSGRKKRSDAGKPRSHRRGAGRFDRRSKKSAETIRELVRIGKPELDVDGMSFLEVVDRDAAAWGDFIAQVGEWLLPVGAFVDLFFGSALVTILNLAPSVRAARRELAERRQRLAEERAAWEEEQAAREAIEHDHEEAAQRGVFGVPAAPEPELTREAWLAGENGGE